MNTLNMRRFMLAGVVFLFLSLPHCLMAFPAANLVSVLFGVFVFLCLFLIIGIVIPSRAILRRHGVKEFLVPNLFYIVGMTFLSYIVACIFTAIVIYIFPSFSFNILPKHVIEMVPDSDFFFFLTLASVLEALFLFWRYERRLAKHLYIAYIVTSAIVFGTVFLLVF